MGYLHHLLLSFISKAQILWGKIFKNLILIQYVGSIHSFILRFWKHFVFLFFLFLLLLLLLSSLIEFFFFLLITCHVYIFNRLLLVRFGCLLFGIINKSVYSIIAIIWRKNQIHSFIFRQASRQARINQKHWIFFLVLTFYYCFFSVCVCAIEKTNFSFFFTE